MTNKVGFHTGPGGNRDGLKPDYIEKLFNDGYTPVIKSVDDYGPVFELFQVTGDNGVGVFRWSDGGYDLPDYSKTPNEAAIEHWNKIREKVNQTPEFDKRTWLEVINEPDKGRSEWLAEFCMNIGQMMINEGYKPSLLSWSSGEPEPEQWLMPQMSNLLRWVSSQNGKASIALHEYDYGRVGMEETYPNHIGRYTKLIDACTQLMVSVPIIISEWGWSYNDIPPEQQAMTDVDWAGKLYASSPDILGAGMWYLGGGSNWDGIADKVQKLIKPVAEWCVNQPNEPVDPPDPPDTGEEWELIINELFEGYNDPQGSDWYDQNGVQQVRNGWLLDFAQGQNNQVPPEQQEDNQYGLMEAVFRWDAFVPEDEQDTLLNDVGHACKMFAGQQAWKGTLSTPVLDEGTYLIELRYYDDNYVDTVDGHKVPPPDPLSFESKVGIGDPKGSNATPWIPSEFLQDNLVVGVFTTDGDERAFVRFRGRWAIKNVSAWVKGITVYRLVDTEPPDPPDPPEECQGVARVPYKREYWVMNSDMSYEEFMVVAEKAFENKKTIGFSYDDAGIGDGLTEKKAVLYNIPEQSRQEYTDWYNEHYPETIVEFRDTSIDDDFMFTDWPTDYNFITQPFGANPEDYEQFGLPGHEGIDIRAYDKTPIYAVADGFISDIKTDPEGHNYGIFIRVDHGNGYETTYAHLDSIISELGDVVSGGDLIALADNTGNSRGSHLHLTLKKEGATANGETDYPYDIIDPTPFIQHLIEQPNQGDVKFGVHTSANGALNTGELDMIGVVKPDIIKILSSMPPDNVTQLKSQNPQADFIVRAFLSWGNRNVTPHQFFQWTVDDVARAVDILSGRNIFIEIHNEPNLTAEGLNYSWFSGSDFAQWWLTVLSLYKAEFGNTVKFMYPGLSPGYTISGVRIDHVQFFNDSREAWLAADVVGCHAYWSPESPISNAVEVVKYYTQTANKPTYVTESSNVSGAVVGSEKGLEYVDFWNRLKTVNGVRGLTYFVMSDQNGTFDNEVWIRNGVSVGIAEVVAYR